MAHRFDGMSWEQLRDEDQNKYRFSAEDWTAYFQRAQELQISRCNKRVEKEDLAPLPRVKSHST